MPDRQARPTSALLIPESPLQVLPTLACTVGLNEAIVLQQLHYWLQRSANERDGRVWVYHTYQQWRAEFPWWSIRTLKDLLPALESRGLIMTANYNRSATDRTKWYTINYEHPQLAGPVAGPGEHAGAAGAKPPLPSPLLIGEPPLQALPTLARAIGLNAAIVLQQLHYRIQRSRHQRDARPWVYNTYENWQAEFPWWSISTLKRIFQDLEASGLVQSANYNKSALDRTKWYTINYEHPILSGTAPGDRSGRPECNVDPIEGCNTGPMAECRPDPIAKCKLDPIEGQNWTAGGAKVDRSNQETLSQETTAQTTPEITDEKEQQQSSPTVMATTGPAGEPGVVTPLRDLIARGITAAIAGKLVGKSDPATIARQIEVYDWLREGAPDTPHLTPGRLRRMIEQDWTPPVDFVPAAERARRAAAAVAAAAPHRRHQEAVQEEERRRREAAAVEYAGLLDAIGLQAAEQAVWRTLVESPRRLPSALRNALFYAPRDTAPPAVIFRQRAEHLVATGAAYAPHRVEIERRLRERYPLSARMTPGSVIYIVYDDLLAALNAAT